MGQRCTLDITLISEKGNEDFWVDFNPVGRESSQAYPLISWQQDGSIILVTVK